LLEAKLSGNVAAMPGQGGRDPENSVDPERRGGMVIIPVHGTLVQYPEDIAMSECGCDMEGLSAMIDAAETDPTIHTVIYDFRTPGGSITGLPETARKILHSRKQTVAFTDSQCASGGLWLAAQCERFYATQSSRVGSCGVYTMSLDQSEAMKRDGVTVNAISAGKYKLLGAYWKPLADDERAHLQAGVDKIYAQFKDSMESHRVVNDKNFGNGLMFDGEEAAEIGFTDGVCESRQELIDMLAEESAD
jgi:ClpP class serine protease